MAKLAQGFDVEREMWIPATKWLTCQGLTCKREFQMPWGICDLVGVEWSHERVSVRRLRRQTNPIGPPVRVAILQLVPDAASGESISIDELSSRMSRPSECIVRELKSLVRGNFVKYNKDGSLNSVVSWVPLHKRIVAVELKLDRIDEAINQARSHVAFATESYVGFPKVVAKRIGSSRYVDVLQAAGVGLLAVAEEGTTVLAKPSSGSGIRRNEVLQMHCIERFWPQITNTVA